MSKKLNVVWNVVSGLSVLYLILLSVEYVVLLILEGAKDIIGSAHLDGPESFITVVAIVIVLIHVIDKIVIEQFLRAREIIEEKADKRKKAAVKKNTSK